MLFLNLRFWRVLAAVAGVAALNVAWAAVSPGNPKGLPFEVVFKGRDKFDELAARSKQENWPSLPLGDRTVAVGKALLGIPYKSYTLEIDDEIEAVSVNLTGLDCWTFFETALAFARMVKECQIEGREPTPNDLLAWIEKDRYRDGQCTGEYLSRLHFLEEWSADNEKRGLAINVTRDMGGVPIGQRKVRDMSAMWKSYRYLRNSPELLPELRRVEAENSVLKVYHIPKSKVGAAEAKMQNGDVICITTNWKGSYSSHVGLAYRDSKGVLRFMHATSSKSKGKKVIIDDRLSGYLNDHSDHAGVFVVRPLEKTASPKAAPTPVPTIATTPATP
jgi:hypothetical protein